MKYHIDFQQKLQQSLVKFISNSTMFSLFRLFLVSRRRSTKSPKPELNFPETERKNGRKVKPALTIERWDPEIEPSSEPVELQPDITIELVREHPIVIPKPGSMIKPRPPDLNRVNAVTDNLNVTLT